jgi:DNA-binding transcriptional regulator YbjK
LADHGANGVTHRKVDRQAGVPDGTTSFYFRTRLALLRGVAERPAALRRARNWPRWSCGPALSRGEAEPRHGTS